MNAEELARRIEAEAAVAARPGQLDSLEQIAREVRALAGAPTADVAAELAEWREYDDAMRKRCLETMDPRLIDATLKNLAGNLYHLRAQLAAAPEGVDAADGRCGCADAEATYAQLEGDYERQADELTAAQAAIQRVEEYLAENGTVLMPGTQEVVIKAGVQRALDGDTTEEGR